MDNKPFSTHVKHLLAYRAYFLAVSSHKRYQLVQFMVLDQYNAVLKSCDANFMHGVEWCCGCVGVCFHLKHTIYSEHIYWSVLIEIERALYICALSPHFTVCDVHISV